MVANSKSHAVSQTAYAGADGNFHAVSQTAHNLKGLNRLPHFVFFCEEEKENELMKKKGVEIKSPLLGLVWNPVPLAYYSM